MHCCKTRAAVVHSAAWSNLLLSIAFVFEAYSILPPALWEYNGTAPVVCCASEAHASRPGRGRRVLPALGQGCQCAPMRQVSDLWQKGSVTGGQFEQFDHLHQQGKIRNFASAGMTALCIGRHSDMQSVNRSRARSSLPGSQIRQNRHQSRCQ